MPTFKYRDIGCWRHDFFDKEGKFHSELLPPFEFNTIEELTEKIKPHFGPLVIENGRVKDGLVIGFIVDDNMDILENFNLKESVE